MSVLTPRFPFRFESRDDAQVDRIKVGKLGRLRAGDGVPACDRDETEPRVSSSALLEERYESSDGSPGATNGAGRKSLSLGNSHDGQDPTYRDEQTVDDQDPSSLLSQLSQSTHKQHRRRSA
jgi:hypothetical protein